MMTSVDTAALMSDYLEHYCSNNIWNMPETEYRQNFIARCVHSIPKTGTFQSGPLYFRLPDNRAYYIYEIPKCCLGNLVINLPTWTRLDDWLDTNPFDFRVTGVNGEWLWRHDIFVTDYPCSDILLIAIESSMARQILGKNYNFKKIYFSVYVDSDGEPFTNLETECYHPRSLAARNEVYGKRLEATFFFINGRESQPVSVDDIKPGDYVELVYDKDVVSDFTLDLSTIGQSLMYRSQLHPQFNYIVHIPKADNPDNYLITHNTCDVFIRPKNIPNAHVKGLFVHRFNTTDRFTQITHNDFGISAVLLDAYMGTDALNTTEVELRIVARRHNKQVKLIREANYLQMLYQLPDEEIVKFLVGRGDESLPFWKASHLEASDYVKLMFDNVAITGIASLSRYISALGYFNTMSVLCKRVSRVKIGPTNTRVFAVDLPVSMWMCPKVSAHVFINGKKLPDDKYTASRTGQYVTININQEVRLPVGTEIVTELFEQSRFKAEYFTPTADKPKLVVDCDVIVFKVKEALDTSIKSDYFVNQYTIDQTFAKVDQDGVYTLEKNSDSTYNLTFTAGGYNNLYLVCSKRLMSSVYKKTFKLGELYGSSITTNMLFVDGKTWSDDVDITIPLLHDVNIIAYLNGRELVERIDFSHVAHRSIDGDMVAQAVHVNNSEYLVNLDANDQPQDNYLEVYATTDHVFTKEDGFITNSVLDTQTVLLYWYQELAKLSCDGLAITNIQYEDGVLRVPDDVRNGALWYIRGIAPEHLDNMFQQYGTDFDTERCLAILNYFKRNRSYTSELVVIPHSHHIYSVVMNEIIRDLLNGTLVLPYDADVSRMKEQVSGYLTAESQDIALAGNHNAIVCRDAGLTKVNQEYQFVDSTSTGANRIWYNAFANSVICYNPVTNRWELRSTIKSITEPYYYAEDPSHGLANPVNLDWQLGPAGVGEPPLLEFGSLDLTFIDVLPSYRLYDSETPEFYRTLEQLKRAILPIDDNRDIRVDQP